MAHRTRLARIERDPTPAQIRRQTEMIRRNWSEQETARRSYVRTPGWLPPICTTDQVLDFVDDAEAWQGQN